MLGLSEKAGDIMRTVDKLDKIGPDKVRTLLVDECGVEADKADEILRFIAITRHERRGPRGARAATAAKTGPLTSVWTSFRP